MDIEFHYHITYILARKGGFSPEDAATIAYACEYTDDNNDKHEVRLDNGDVYENFISQTLDIRRPKDKLVRIYSCFHFLPGDYLSAGAARTDGALHLFNTTPDSPPARQMFLDALKTGNPYRIGIATHCYADTWAHQNFVGFKHGFGERDGLLAKAIPTIGHADFQHEPDIPNLAWQDQRLLAGNAAVSNRTRFLAAAKAIFTAFAAHNGLQEVENLWPKLEEELTRAIGDECADVKRCSREQADRIARYRQICPDMPDYGERDWLEAAVEPATKTWEFWKKAGDWGWQRANTFIKAYWPKNLRIRSFRAKPGFAKSPWYQFQEAVKEHQRYVMSMLHDRYQQIGAALQKVW